MIERTSRPLPPNVKEAQLGAALGGFEAVVAAGPCLRGTVILDLRRTNRILAVDEELAYARVEHGVTFFELCEHIRWPGARDEWSGSSPFRSTGPRDQLVKRSAAFRAPVQELWEVLFASRR